MNRSAKPANKLRILESDPSAHSLSELTYQWFNQSAFGAALMDVECRFIDVNPAFCSMLGYGEAQLQQLNMQAIVHPDELLRCMHLSSQLAAGSIASFQTEQRFIHQSGEPVWCSVYSALLCGEQGEPRYLLMQTQNINGQKKLEAALDTSVHTFSSLLESLPFALAIVNREWEFSFMNKAAKELFQCTNGEWLGRNLWKLFPHAVRSPFYKAFHRAMDEKTFTYIHEYCEYTKRWYEISCQPTKEGLCLFLRETTLLKIQEDAYQQSQQQIASMIDHAPYAVSVLDMQYRILKVNAAYSELFGFTEDELLGKEPPIVPDELMMETRKLYQQAAKGRQIVGFETRRLHKDRRILDVNLTMFPLKNAENVITALFVFVQNISEGKQMERQLQQSKENYRIIAEHTHDLIALLSPDGIIRYASPSHERVTGIKAETLVNTCLFEFLEEPWKSQAEAFFYEMIRSKEPRIIEMCWPSFNGESSKTLEMRGVPVVGQEGNIDTVVVISRDISERKHTEELLRHSDKLLVAGQLAAGIAHEIRNPLTALKGFTQFMYKGGPYKEQYLTIMLSELTRIEQIISELLMLAKPQAVTYKKQPLEPILRDVISLLRSQANLNGVQMLLHIRSALPPVHCEENQLKQVFINLLKNGIEAMPHGGVVRIITQTTDHRTLSVAFQDQGNGIPAEKLSRLGEPFFTTKEKGSGLGLMISQKILREHGGTLHFSSEPGFGTTATVELPGAAD